MSRSFSIILTIVLLNVALFVQATEQTDYATLKIKSERFFNYSEWPSALAMYQLMLQQKPQDPSTYSKAILTAGLMNDSTKQQEFMDEVMQYAVPLDSVFSGIRDGAVALSRPKVYVDFMMLARQQQPWMARAIDIKLLNFYEFRRDADSIIPLAKTLLETSPHDVDILNVLGNAYMLKGEYENAAETFRAVLTVHPNDTGALLTVGNFYVRRIRMNLDIVGISLSELPQKGRNWNEIVAKHKDFDKTALLTDNILALEYLSRANSVKSTPYLRNIIFQLEQLRRITSQKASK